MRLRTTTSAAAAGFVAAAALVAVPASARAAISGELTLTAAKGVTVAAGKPATRRGRAVSLPVTAASFAGGAVVDAGGSITLKAAGRTLTLTAPRLSLGAHSRLSARVGKTRRTVFTLAPNVMRLDQTSVRLPATKVTLTAAVQRTLRLKTRKLGTLAAGARVDQPAVAPTGPAAVCPPNTRGGAPPDPGTGEPPIKSQPANALAVTSATVTWHVRDSFIRYIATGEGTTASAGATGDPAADDGLVYAYHFPSTGGWCDPATGAARLTFSGTVGFSYRDHGIDLRASSPELELDGAASRLIFDLSGQRQVIETLDVSEAVVSASAKTLTYDRIPGAIPPGAAGSVFAGYYLPGDPFGWVSITFTTS